MWDPLRHLWLAAVVVSQSSSLGQQAEAGWACEQRKSGLLPRVTRNKQKMAASYPREHDECHDDVLEHSAGDDPEHC